MEPLLISIHIPKTAGTTFGSILKKRYGDKLLYVYQALVPGEFCYGRTPQEAHQDIENGKGVGIREVMYYVFKHHIRAIHGHVPMSYFLPFEGRFDIKYITFLREPNARAFSNYCHLRVFESKIDTGENLYRDSSNQLYKFTEGMLEKFWYIGSSETWEEDLKNLGLEDIPKENITPRHSLKPNDDLIKKYNYLDQEIWERYKSTYAKRQAFSGTYAI